MVFDRQKLEDEYIKMNEIILSSPPESMAGLYRSAENYRMYATEIYNTFVHALYSHYTPRFRDMKEYASPKDFMELEELIANSEDGIQRNEYERALKEFVSRFTKEAEVFNESILSLLKKVQSNRADLERNFREDLTSTAFFYGGVEKALQIRGQQIADMALIIKDYHIAPIVALAAKIREYNQEIDEFLDPQKRFDAFMAALPDANEFSSLTKYASGRPDAQVDGMKSAYSVAIKGVKYISNIIANIKKMEEAEKLREELRNLMNKFYEYESKYKVVIHEYNLVKNLVVILNGMKFFSACSEAFVDFLDASAHKLLKDTEERNVKGYYEEMIKIENYFNKFRQ